MMKTPVFSCCQVMPCDRLLIFKMLKRWYGRENDPKGEKLYLERFNFLVQVFQAALVETTQNDVKRNPYHVWHIVMTMFMMIVMTILIVILS